MEHLQLLYARTLPHESGAWEGVCSGEEDEGDWNGKKWEGHLERAEMHERCDLHVEASGMLRIPRMGLRVEGSTGRGALQFACCRVLSPSWLQTWYQQCVCCGKETNLYIHSGCGTGATASPARGRHRGRICWGVPWCIRGEL